MKELILHAINTGEEVSLPFKPIREIEEVLNELGFDTDEPEYDNTNGWQVDFWFSYYLDNKKYWLEGSLYYGNFKFYLNN